MSPTVELTDRTVERLDELRDEIERETGVSVTRQVVLERIVARASRSPEGVVDMFRDG